MLNQPYRIMLNTPCPITLHNRQLVLTHLELLIILATLNKVNLEDLATALGIDEQQVNAALPVLFGKLNGPINRISSHADIRELIRCAHFLQRYAGLVQLGVFTLPLQNPYDEGCA